VKDYTREALAASIVAHAAVVVLAVSGLPMLGRDRPDAPQVIPVEFVEIARESRSEEPVPVREPEPEPAPEEPEPKPEPEPEPAPEEAAPLPEEKNAPPPDAAPTPEPKPEPEREPVRVTPRAKPKPPSRFDANRLAALIDRSIKEDSARQEQTPPEQTATDKTDAPQQQAALSGRIATASLQAIIRDRVQQCWTLPAGAKGLDELHVRIRIHLRRDGTLARAPQILDQARIARSDDSYLRIFAESARRAVQVCEPYDDLPVAYYDIWQQIDFNFNAGQMLGG